MSSSEYFKGVSGKWDSMREQFFSEKVRDEAAIKVKTESGKTAADIGAGTGFITEGLLNAGLNVVAVDSSTEMLEVLKQKFGHFREVRIVQTTPDRINVADNSVDYVFANMYLHHVDDPLAMIKEMVRILKPGGKLALTDLTEHKYEELLKEHHDRWPGFNMPDLYEWFVKAGLKEISIEVLNQSCTCESECGNKISIGIFLAYGEKH